MQKLQNQALRKCTGAAYRSSGEKVEKIAGVEPVDTILDRAQTRFFARAVADPAAIGDLWMASLKPDNQDSELTEEEGRDWRDHGAYWVQNNKTDRYISVASRIATTAVQDSEATISWGGEVEPCEVEEARIGCSASCAADVWEEKIEESEMPLYSQMAAKRKMEESPGAGPKIRSRQAPGMEEDTLVWGQQYGMEKWREWQKL